MTEPPPMTDDERADFEALSEVFGREMLLDLWSRLPPDDDQ